MIYKFYNYNDDNFEKVVEGTLINPKLRFTNPTKLNDENEFKFDIRFDLSKPEELRVNYLKELGGDETHFNDFIASLKDPREVDNKKAIVRTQCLQVFSVCSLTRTCRRSSMWGHYADSSKGFCVIYKDNLISSLHTLLPPILIGDVKYESDLPVFDFNKDSVSDFSFNHLPFVKSNEWFAEEEIRLVAPQNTFNGGDYSKPNDLDLHCFDEIPVFGVITGIKMNDAKYEFIKDVCSKNGYKLFSENPFQLSQKFRVGATEKFADYIRECYKKYVDELNSFYPNLQKSIS